MYKKTVLTSKAVVLVTAVVALFLITTAVITPLKISFATTNEIDNFATEGNTGNGEDTGDSGDSGDGTTGTIGTTEETSGTDDSSGDSSLSSTETTDDSSGDSFTASTDETSVTPNSQDASIDDSSTNHDDSSSSSTELQTPTTSAYSTENANNTNLQADKNPMIGLPPSPIETHTVKVTFNSITIKDDHESFLQGDGEYNLAAYVQGKPIVLSNINKALHDAAEGNTYNFPSTASTTVTTTGGQPLLLEVGGEENDWCQPKTWPDLQQQMSSRLASFAETNQSTNTDIKDQIIKDAINYVLSHYKDIGCGVNKNDELGTISKTYQPPSFDVGKHEETSSSKDYILRYTIETIK